MGRGHLTSALTVILLVTTGIHSECLKDETDDMLSLLFKKMDKMQDNHKEEMAAMLEKSQNLHEENAVMKVKLQRLEKITEHKHEEMATKWNKHQEEMATKWDKHQEVMAAMRDKHQEEMAAMREKSQKLHEDMAVMKEKLQRQEEIIELKIERTLERCGQFEYKSEASHWNSTQTGHVAQHRISTLGIEIRGLEENLQALQFNFTNTNSIYNDELVVLRQNLTDTRSQLSREIQSRSGSLSDSISKMSELLNSLINVVALQEIDFEAIGGEAKATSSWDANWAASNVFTHKKHGWHPGSGTSLPQNIWYEFEVPQQIRKFSFQSRTDGRSPASYGPSSYIFWASNGEDCTDESTWDILLSDLSDTPFTDDNKPKEEYVINDKFYRCYGFKVVNCPGTYPAIHNVQMYHTLTDIDECEANDGKGDCEHSCTNTVGSYTCSCREGFTLNDDDKTCRGCRSDGVIIAGQCLTFSNESLSWTDAKEKCSSLSGRLATLTDPLAFRNYANSNYGEEYFWLGGSDIANEGEWIWLDGTLFGDEFPWKSGEPNNLRGKQHCLQFGYYRNYDDNNCNETKSRFVCEYGQEYILDEIDLSLPKTGQTSYYVYEGQKLTADGAFFNLFSWNSDHSGTPQALWISFAFPVPIKKFSFQSRDHANYRVSDGPSKYVFFGSNSANCSDSSSWITLFEDDSRTPFTTANTPKTELVPGERSFTCYGFNVKEVPGRSSGQVLVSMANITLYTTGLQEIDLNSIGVGATSYYNEGERPENAFVINGNHWQSAHGKMPQTPQAIWYKFPVPVVIAKFSFRSRNDRYVIDCGPTSYEFFGSNSSDCSDQSSWVTLFQDLSDTPFTTENIPKAGYVSNPAPYLCYGFKVLKISHQPYGSAMTNIRFFAPRK